MSALTTPPDLHLRVLRGQSPLNLRQLAALLSGEWTLSNEELGRLPQDFRTLTQISEVSRQLSSGQPQAHRAALALTEDLGARVPAPSTPFPEDSGGEVPHEQLLRIGQLWLIGQGAANLHARLMSGARPGDIAPLARAWARALAGQRTSRSWTGNFLHESGEFLSNDVSDPPAYQMIQQAHAALLGEKVAPEQPEPRLLNWHHLSLLSRSDHQITLATVVWLSKGRYAQGNKLIKSGDFWSRKISVAARQMNKLWLEHQRLYPAAHRTDWGEHPLVSSLGMLRLPRQFMSTPSRELQTVFMLAWAAPHVRSLLEAPLPTRELTNRPELAKQALAQTISELLSKPLEDQLRQALEEVHLALRETGHPPTTVTAGP